ncbi:MAG: acyl carrier protein [Myxococcales bacterium]|nr:acyl carrier protein [Myxococcales bacterium]
MAVADTIKTYITTELAPDLDASKLANDQSLLTTGVLDSLRIVKLIAFLDDEFGVEVTDDEFDPDNFETIDAIAKLVEEKKG